MVKNLDYYFGIVKVIDVNGNETNGVVFSYSDEKENTNGKESIIIYSTEKNLNGEYIEFYEDEIESIEEMEE